MLEADPTDIEDRPVSKEGLEIGQRARLIRKARNALGLSQMEFANRFCISVETLMDWEQAKSMVPDFAIAYVNSIQI